MKLLHTSDWHVGRAIRGHSRAQEHRDVLDEIVAVAASEAVDLVLVAGDLFDTAAPNAESEGIVYNGLLALAEVAPVIVIAGNHDNVRRLDAVARLLALGRVTMATEPRSPADGGVVELTVGDGTPVKTALIPFVSQRAIVRADALMSEPAFRNAQTYATRLRAVIAALSSTFNGDSVNLVLAHLFVAGGAAGGGERAAHLVEEYAVAAVDFPVGASYVALGHLHRPQALAGATSIHYSGSPLQLDFGEQAEAKQVNLVSIEPGLPARVSAVPLRSGRPLRTLTGTVAEVEMAAAEVGDAWLRIRVREPARAGLADEVRALVGEAAVDIRVEQLGEVAPRPKVVRRDGRSPRQLFAAYLGDREIVDPRLERAFDSLHEAVWSGDDDTPIDLDLAPREPEPEPMRLEL
ncbi:MAG: exonuclease SbcCD subunit D [Actinomycetia bacterium]|nr:exonuclease SbcCD subunit D [Actinomycetes bacterium]